MPRLTLEPVSIDVQPLRFATRGEAVEWFYVERGNLVAAVQAAVASELDRIASQLPVLLHETYSIQWLFADWFTMSQLGLQAARRDGDATVTAMLLDSLGIACQQSHRLAEATEYQLQALAIYQHTGNIIGIAWALNLLGVVEGESHHMAEAFQYLEQSMAIYQDNGYEALTGIPLVNLSWAYEEFGQPHKAIEFSQRALGLFQADGNRVGVRVVHKRMTNAYLSLGQIDRALEHAEATLAIDREVGGLAFEGHTLITYGNIQQAAGRLDDALASYQRSASILRRLGARSREAWMRQGPPTSIWGAQKRPFTSIAKHWPPTATSTTTGTMQSP